MEHYVGIDVSLELSSVCVVDVVGKIVAEAKVESHPAAIINFLRKLGLSIERIGLEVWISDRYSAQQKHGARHQCQRRKPLPDNPRHPGVNRQKPRPKNGGGQLRKITDGSVSGE